MMTLVCTGMLGVGCSSDAPSDSTGNSESSRPQALSEKVIAGKTRPKVEVPDIPIPKELVVRDLEVGRGPRASAGDHVKVEYVGINWQGVIYGDSWTYPSPPIFVLGQSEGRRLDHGVDLGVRGMRVGGRREMIIPPNLFYWPDEAHSTPPSKVDASVYVVDLLEIR